MGKVRGSDSPLQPAPRGRCWAVTPKHGAITRAMPCRQSVKQPWRLTCGTHQACEERAQAMKAQIEQQPEAAE